MKKQNDNEVIAGGFKKGRSNGKQRQPGITPIDMWEKDFDNLPYSNDIDKILEFPGTDDMAGVLARGNFKNERQRVAAVRLAYKNRKFHDDNHQKMLRDFIASGVGMSALGKLLQLQASTNLIAPAVLREALGMKQMRHREDVQRGSDFRDKENGQNNQQVNNQQ